MLEIEQRYVLADSAALERRLPEWGARFDEEVTEADHYFNAPDRDFAQTGEAFRLRRMGQSNFLTYKGPRQAAAVKVRTEIEVPLADGDQSAQDFMRLLRHLGYRFVTVVRKRRRSYRAERGGFPLTICFDEVDLAGRFIELEILVPEGQEDVAARVLADTAASLNLTQVETRSYLGMVLAAEARATIKDEG